MLKKDEGRLLLPGEENEDKLPRPLKALLFLLALVAFITILMNECSVQEPDYQDRLGEMSGRPRKE